MLEIAAFMLGFSAVLSVYEVCKGSKQPMPAFYHIIAKLAGNICRLSAYFKLIVIPAGNVSAYNLLYFTQWPNWQE